MKKIVPFLLLFLLIFPLLEDINASSSSSVKIVRPRNGIYIMDKKVLPIVGQVVIGGVTVMADASDDITGVEFMVPPKVGCRPVVIYNDTSPPIPFTGISPLMD